MTQCRVVPVAAAVLLGLLAEAAAQGAPAPWPAQPTRPAQAAWPAQAPQQAPAQAPWPAQPAQPAQPGFGAPVAPSGFGAPAAPGGFGAPPPQRGGPPCMAEFAPMKAEAEKRGSLIKAAADRKAERSELCKLFRSFAEAEGKVVKYVTEHQAQCAIPPQAVKQVKANHARTLTFRDKICAEGPVGAQGPSGPGLGEALGARALPTPDAGSRGVFDTMTGNPLIR